MTFRYQVSAETLCKWFQCLIQTNTLNSGCYTVIVILLIMVMRWSIQVWWSYYNDFLLILRCQRETHWVLKQPFNALSNLCSRIRNRCALYFLLPNDTWESVTTEKVYFVLLLCKILMAVNYTCSPKANAHQPQRGEVSIDTPNRAAEKQIKQILRNLNH